MMNLEGGCMPSVFKWLGLGGIIFILMGCYSYSYSCWTSYGLIRVDTKEYIGLIDYKSWITSSVVELESGMSVKFTIPHI